MALCATIPAMTSRLPSFPPTSTCCSSVSMLLVAKDSVRRGWFKVDRIWANPAIFTRNFYFGVGELPMLRFATVAAVCLLAPVALSMLIDPTLAQSSAQQLTVVSPRPVPAPIPPRAGPMPLVGVGLPLFGGVLGVVMFIRGYWRKQ